MRKVKRYTHTPEVTTDNYNTHISILALTVMCDLDGLEANGFLNPHLPVAGRRWMHKHHLTLIVDDIGLSNGRPLSSDVLVPVLIR